MHESAELILNGDHALVEHSGLHGTGSLNHVQRRVLHEELVLLLAALILVQILLLDHLLQVLTECLLDLNELELHEDRRVAALVSFLVLRSGHLLAILGWSSAALQR